MHAAIGVLRSERLAIVAGLGFASGLPRYLTAATLVAWMTTAGVDLATIGAFALVGLPYTFKWAWAPLFDRYPLPWLGRRRGWLLVLQVALALAIAGLGTTDPQATPGAVAMLAVAVAALSASHDVVVDAFNAETLRPDERAAGSAAYVLGYRIALLVTGAGALAIASSAAWSVVYLACAALMAACVMVTLVAAEPAATAPPRTLVAAVVVPLRALLVGRGAIAVLVVVALFNLGEQLGLHVVPALLLRELELSLATIAVVSPAAGIAGVLVGGAIVGVLAPRLGGRRALLVFGPLAALANLGYAALAGYGPSLPLYAGVVFVDQACNTMGSAALVAFLMAQCDRRSTATQYALLTALAGLGARLLGVITAPLIEAVGWPGFFALTAAMMLPALGAVLLVPPARFEASVVASPR